MSLDDMHVSFSKLSRPHAGSRHVPGMRLAHKARALGLQGITHLDV